MRQIALFSLVASTALHAQSAAPTLTKKLTIGCESCGDATQFGNIWDVAVTAQGEILVTDRDAPMLRRFNASGRPAWSGGRKGKGPGEFTLPIRSVITPGGMVVIDMSNSRLTEPKPDGQVASSVTLTSMATTSGANRTGAVILGYDDMGRAFRVMGRAPGASELTLIASFPGSYKNKSVALAPDGAIAVALDGEQ